MGVEGWGSASWRKRAFDTAAAEGPLNFCRLIHTCFCSQHLHLIGKQPLHRPFNICPADLHQLVSVWVYVGKRKGGAHFLLLKKTVTIFDQSWEIFHVLCIELYARWADGWWLEFNPDVCLYDYFTTIWGVISPTFSKLPIHHTKLYFLENLGKKSKHSYSFCLFLSLLLESKLSLSIICIIVGMEAGHSGLDSWKNVWVHHQHVHMHVYLYALVSCVNRWLHIAGNSSFVQFGSYLCSLYLCCPQ